MVAVTYGVAPTAESKSASKGTGRSFFKVLFDAIADSQMKRAERELARYHYLIARDGDRDVFRSR